MILPHSLSLSVHKAQTPVGVLYLVEKSQQLFAVMFEPNWDNFTQKYQTHFLDFKMTSFLENVEKQFQEYFLGKRKIFDIPSYAQGTIFQNKVWNATKQLPFGSICTYKDLASSIDMPNAVRAVGLALGQNPLLIVCPCHRVVGKKNVLTGYAAGIEIKRKLLELENDILVW